MILMDPTGGVLSAANVSAGKIRKKYKKKAKPLLILTGSGLVILGNMETFLFVPWLMVFIPYFLPAVKGERKIHWK